MADIKKTLPQSVGESRGIGEILDSCGTELDLLEQEARAACLRLAAATADSKGCALWERELGLEVREDLPLSARRVLIQVALEQMDTCTPEKLRAFNDYRMLAYAVVLILVMIATNSRSVKNFISALTAPLKKAKKGDAEHA